MFYVFVFFSHEISEQPPATNTLSTLFLQTITPGFPILFSFLRVISSPRIDDLEDKNIDPPQH
jgi:hypothetical protein